MNASSYPLKSHFWRRIAPGLAVLLAAIVAATVFAVIRTTESIYLELARQRAEAISSAVSHSAPDAWAHLLAHGDTQADHAKLRGAIDQEVRELKIQAMKVYNLAGQVLFSTDAADFAKRETNEAMKTVVFDGTPVLVRITENGQQLYEIYVPVRDAQGDIAAVFELYEPVDYLDALLLRSGAIAAAVPAGGLILLLAGLGMLVGRGQREIDSRSAALAETQRKLESFVSTSAVDAARGGGDIPSKRVRLTLFYSDARDFTGYSENNPPERVVWFLNELMGIQVAAVQAHGGDVDKMIGDALLARFDGDGAEARALAAARDVQSELARANLPRPVGIGIYTGEVISGAIGAANRRDFTVIGDGVNVSARLCSAAAADEIVADRDTLAAAGKTAGNDADAGFGPVEDITVKGRREPVSIRRLTAAGTQASR
jgi:class 3 adenylate cyclase